MIGFSTHDFCTQITLQILSEAQRHLCSQTVSSPRGWPHRATPSPSVGKGLRFREKFQHAPRLTHDEFTHTEFLCEEPHLGVGQVRHCHPCLRKLKTRAIVLLEEQIVHGEQVLGLPARGLSPVSRPGLLWPLQALFS